MLIHGYRSCHRKVRGRERESIHAFRVYRRALPSIGSVYSRAEVIESQSQITAVGTVDVDVVNANAHA